jgi:hypothetical protein
MSNISMVKTMRLQEIFKSLGVMCLWFIYVWLACAREGCSFNNNSTKVDFSQTVCRVSTGLENPGKSLNWKKNSRTGKSLKISRSP